MEKSLIEYAYDFVSGKKGPSSFQDLWAYVVETSGLSEEQAKDKVGKFYTSLLLDGRFVNLGDNQWDLRTNHTFDKVHIDMKDVYSDVETSDDEDIEEGEEEKEYNEAFEEPKDEDDELSDIEPEEDQDL